MGLKAKDVSLTADYTAPAEDTVAVTPNDSTDLAQGACRGIYVGGDGNISVDTPGGSTAVIITAAKAGTILPIRATRIRLTGTTATALLALY